MALRVIFGFGIADTNILKRIYSALEYVVSIY
jgi:hypothetical protein